MGEFANGCGLARAINSCQQPDIQGIFFWDKGRIISILEGLGE